MISVLFWQVQIFTQFWHQCLYWSSPDGNLTSRKICLSGMNSEKISEMNELKHYSSRCKNKSLDAILKTIFITTISVFMVSTLPFFNIYSIFQSNHVSSVKTHAIVLAENELATKMKIFIQGLSMSPWFYQFPIVYKHIFKFTGVDHEPIRIMLTGFGQCLHSFTTRRNWNKYTLSSEPFTGVTKNWQFTPMIFL